MQTHTQAQVYEYTNLQYHLFLSMWSYGEDVDLTLYLGHRSLYVGRYAFAHNSV